MSYRESQVAYWNRRAMLGVRAGTDDWIAEELERRAIERHIYNGMRIIEMGCGNGALALRLAKEWNVEIRAYDLSPTMINCARQSASRVFLRGRVWFEVRDTFIDLSGEYDLAITERCIVNLPDWPAQREAIITMLGLASRYVMVENSQEGLERINALRARLALPPIVPPWHNRYLREDEIEALAREQGYLLRREHITSTYAFVSRVLNAALAQSAAREPHYDDPINTMCLSMPSSVLSGLGSLGQTKLWSWSRP